MKTGFHKTENGNILFGKDFPEHLQIAYGRNQARLQCFSGIPCKLWLRDLPLNLEQLAYDLGFGLALISYRQELMDLAFNGKIPVSVYNELPHVIDKLGVLS